MLLRISKYSYICFNDPNQNKLFIIFQQYVQIFIKVFLMQEIDKLLLYI